MIETYATLVLRAREWFERATTAGWFDEADRRRINTVEQATPADLFAEDQIRPLVVALFGGTGVGKSSLLNQLAGETVARVGVERPTSRDVTMYVHESVQLAALPPELPVDRVQIKRHGSAAFREVLWIDAPDIDSIEEANRQCAMAWLPHVDLLCYVVSPERYRDDVGWRVLCERGHKHGWVFVMNRWDEGDVRQREDFDRMLREAGFDPPLLLCTCCIESSSPLPSADESDQVRTTIRELLAVHAVHELTRLGHRARLQELRGVVVELQRRFGDEAVWEKVLERFRDRWQEMRNQLLQGAVWIIQSAAARFAVREGGLVKNLGRRIADLRSDRDQQEQPREAITDAGELGALTATLWDDWSQSKLAGCLDTIEITLGRYQLATSPLRQRLDESSACAGETVLEPVQDQVREVLVRPGNLLVRVGRRVTGFLMIALPAFAVAVVGYWVVVGYYRATKGDQPFLGTDFAVHSLLLVAAAWGLPFLLDRLLRPSLEAAVMGAMRRGFGSGLDELGTNLAGQIQAAAGEARQYRAECQAILKESAGLMLKPVDVRSPILLRVIAARKEEPAAQ